MVKLQLECAGKNGAHIVPKTAVEIEATYDNVVVTTNGYRVIPASKVLLCTDAYTIIFNLILILIELFIFPEKELLDISYTHILILLSLQKLEKKRWRAW